MPKKYNLGEPVVQVRPSNGLTKSESERKPKRDSVQLTSYDDPVQSKNSNGVIAPKATKPATMTADDKKASVSVIGLYRYSTAGERVSLVFGLFFALCGGSGMSVSLWYTATILNDFYMMNFTGLNNSEQLQYDEIINIAKTGAIVMFIIQMATFLCSFLGMMLFLRASDKVVHRVRQLAFRNILRQHMGFFDLNEPGAIITSLAEDCIKYQSGSGEKMVSLATWLAGVIVSTVIAFLGDWLLALCAYAFLPVTLIASICTTQKIRKLAQSQFYAYSKAGVIAEESLSAIRIVQAFCGIDKQSQRYDKRLNDARILGEKAGYFIALVNGIAFMMAFLVISVVFWVGGIRFLEGKLVGPGAIIQVTYSAGLSMRNLAWIANTIEFTTTARAAASSIYSYITCQSQIDSLDPTGEKPSEVSGDITFEDVHFEYPSRPDVPVQKGLSLTIPRGKSVALVGPSGCGKSTTIQLIQRYYDPRKGVIKLDGKDVTKLNLKWLRTQIGVVAQEPVLFATTVEENIRFGRPGATTAEIVECAKAADAHDFIMQLPNGYETMLNEAATLLSRGEKQRVSLARALVRQPKVLLLDECTSALDTESEVVVQKALERASKGRTTITIAHRLSTVRNSDILYVINEGILWEQGNHEELMVKNGLYYNLVVNQTKGMEKQEDKDDSDDSIDMDDMKMTDGKLTRSPSMISTRSARETLEALKRAAEEEDPVMDEETSSKVTIKRIMSYNKPETCIIAIGCIGAMLFGFGVPAIAILTGEVYRMFTITDYDEQKKIVDTFCPIMVGVVVFVSISSFASFATLKKAGEWLTQRLRSHLFRHVLSMEIGWFDRKENQVGALTSRLANEASRVQAVTGTVLVSIFSTLSTLGGAIVVAIVYGWKLGLPLLAYTPFVLSVSILQSVVSTKFAQWTAAASREGGKVIAEAIDKIQVVASLTKEDFFEERFSEFFKDLAVKERKKALLGGLIWGLTYFFMCGALVLSFPYGLYLVANGDIKVEDILRILFGVTTSMNELARLNVYATEFNRARAAAGQCFKLLDRPSQIHPLGTGGLKPDTAKCELEVKNCFFKYPTRHDLIVLKNFNITVKRGQFIALVGPSGSGKTTAITLFERFYDTIQGDVMVDGIKVTDMNLDWLRTQISIVTQDPILFNIPIGDNIAFGDNTREVSKQEVIEAAKCANIHNFIASLPNGYDTLAGNKGTQLSGGQKQRVSIARALIKNPKILLLDDAMSALDAESEKMVEVALENAREGRTTIMVSHRLSSILQADVIYYIDNGKVLEKGSHTELMTKHGYYFRLQQASHGISE